MRDSWRHFAAEFIGIFALVFVGGAAIMTTQMAHSENVLLAVAAAHGIALAVMVTATWEPSGTAMGVEVPEAVRAAPE